MRSLLLDRRARPVRNLAPVPRPVSGQSTIWVPRWFGSGGNGTSALSTVNAVNGRAFIRKTWTVAPVSPEDTAVTVRNLPVVPGKRYTMTVRVRSSIAQRMRGFADASISVRGAASLGGTYQAVASTSTSGSVNLLPGIWATLKTTFVVPEGVYVLEAFPYVNAVAGGATNWAVGDTFDMGDMMLVEGVYDGVYCDGDTPGWRWTGAAGVSESVGWPYTLDSIAGKPMASIEGDGVQAAITGQSFDPFSVYWVYDAYAPAAEWTEPFAVLGTATPAAWSTGWATHGALSFGRRNLSDYTYAHSRLGTGPSPLDNRNGINPTQMNETRAWEAGRHVVAQAMTFPGGTDARLLTMIDGKVDHVMTYAGGAGIGIARALIRARTPSASANLPTPVNANALAIRGLFYAANHDRTTRLAVARWLANRYGTALAV